MKRLAAVAAVAALALALAWSGGCVSAPLPPASGDGAVAAPMDLTVGVEPARVEAFSDELLRSLRASGAFARVERIDRLATPPDLLARVEHGWEGTAAIPILTVLSLGLVPTIVEETYGLAFTLRAPGSASPAVAIDARWTGRIWLGLASAPLNLSPDRTGADWRGHPRWAAHLRRSVGRRSPEIEALAGRPPGSG